MFGTGIVLAVAGPVGRQPWLFLHKASFVIWFCAMTVHVLAYLPRLPRLLAAESRGAAGHSAQGARGRRRWPVPGAAVLGGRGVRLSLLAASLVAGLVIAMLTVHLAGPWQFDRFANNSP